MCIGVPELGYLINVVNKDLCLGLAPNVVSDVIVPGVVVPDVGVSVDD